MEQERRSVNGNRTESKPRAAMASISALENDRKGHGGGTVE